MMTHEETPKTPLHIDPLAAGMKVSEFVKRFPFAKATIYRWASEKRIKTVRFGRSVFIPMTEVERILDEGLRAPSNTDAA